MVVDSRDPGTRPMALALPKKETNRERQKAFKARQRELGLVQRTYWVTKEQDEAIVAMLANPKAVSRIEKRKRDDVRDKNQSIVNKHVAEIRRRRKAGEKPTAIAAWLTSAHGFKGNGATLNGLIRL